MNKSASPLLRVNDKYVLKTAVFALIAACLMFVPIIIIGNGVFYYYGDYNAQQIPFNMACHRAVRSGDIFWNDYTDLGVNFIGSYSFYVIGSPFFWLMLPFPTSFVPYLLGPLLILKFVCAAVFAAVFIRRFVKNPVFAVVGGMLYAFSGFSLYNIFFNHFHEAIVFFPLLLLGLEKLMCDGRKGVFALFVAVCAAANYFFFIAMAVFLVPYFIFRAVSGEWRLGAKKILCVALESIIGVMIASAIFVPSILEVLENSRATSMLSGWDLLLYSNSRLYANIFISIFLPSDMSSYPLYVPNAYTNWASLSAYIPLFSTVGVVSLLISKKGNWLRRLLLFCTVCAFIPALNSAFVMLNTSYYARWFFMPTLMMCLATAVCFDSPGEYDIKRGIRYTLIITVIIVVCVGFIPSVAEIGGEEVNRIGLYNLGYDSDSNTWNPIRFYANSALALLSIVTVALIYRSRRYGFKRYASLTVVMTLVFCSLSGMYMVYAGRASDSDATEYSESGLLGGQPELPDADDYRVEIYEYETNAAMYWGERSISCFHSVVPASVMDYYIYIGDKRDVTSDPDTGFYATRSLLGVKYIADYRLDNDSEYSSFVRPDGSTAISGFEFAYTSGNFDIYENKNYIGAGFVYNSLVKESFLSQAVLTACSRDTYMLYGCLLGDEDADSLENEYYYVTDPSANGDITGICAQLRKTAVWDFEKNNRGYTMKCRGEGLCFISVPYHSGWTAYIDGEKAEIYRANIGFMAVEAGDGEHDIELYFEPPGLKEGLILSSIGVLLLIIYVSVHVIKNKKVTEFGDKE